MLTTLLEPSTSQKFILHTLTSGESLTPIAERSFSDEGWDQH